MLVAPLNESLCVNIGPGGTRPASGNSHLYPGEGEGLGLGFAHVLPLEDQKEQANEGEGRDDVAELREDHGVAV